MSIREIGWAINGLTVLIVIANLVFVLLHRRRLYRHGWIDGRIDLLQHMNHAATHDVDFETFVRQVAARDGYLIPGDLPTKGGPDA